MTLPDPPEAIVDPPGSLLFHYTRLDTALESIFDNWRLRMNPLSKMRDPRERLRWGLEGHYTSLEAPRGDVLADTHRFVELQQLADRLKNQVKVLALTQDDPGERDEASAIFGRGFAHPRLWEQYGDNHRGVCLCFHREALIDSLTRELAREGTVYHGPVRYRDAEIDPAALSVQMIETRGLPTDDALRDHVTQHRDELFFTKLRDWEGESEYRFIILTPSDNPEPVYADVRKCLRAVIIGEDVSMHYRPALRRLCDPVNAEIRRIRWLHGKPRLQDPFAEGYS